MTTVADLQLERAEFDQPATACAYCQEPLRDQYFEVNGQVACLACRERVGTVDYGSRASRVARAVGAGVGAAFLGSVLYWMILAATGYEFGLIAVLVGIAVGRGVAWGSRGKGGWRYQTLAVALTYLAMVSAYAPMVLTELSKPPVETAATTPAGTPAEPAPAPAASTETETPPTFGEAVIALGFLIGLLCALPFLAGIQNIIGILILGFGMYEAWKTNRRVAIVITGPHALAPVAQGV